MKASKLLKMIQLAIIERNSTTTNADKLEEYLIDLSMAGVKTYGNKGRCWSNTACITNLDKFKGECNPRLAFNHSSIDVIGCPECLSWLEANPSEDI